MRDFDYLLNRIFDNSSSLLFKNCLSDFSEDELKAALERKTREKEQKLSRKEQLKAKVLSNIFQEGAEIIVDDESTKKTAVLKFKTKSGLKGTMAISIEEDNFFT